MLTLLKMDKNGRHLFLGTSSSFPGINDLALVLDRYRLSNLPTLEFLREADALLKRDYSQVIKQSNEPPDPRSPKLLSLTQISKLENAIEKGLIAEMMSMQIQSGLDGFRRFVVITASTPTTQAGNAVSRHWSAAIRPLK